MKRRLAFLLATVAICLAGTGAAARATDSATVSPNAITKTCGAGYVHGIIGGQHKCLRRGQFCARRYDRQYHRYGFHCHTGRLLRR